MKTLATCALAIAFGSVPGLSQAQSDVDAKMVAKGALAPADKKPEEGPWSGAVAGGYAKTSGNSRSTATNLKAEGRYDQNRWHHILGATAVAGRSAASRGDLVENTGEAYWAGFQSQYDFTDSI